MAIRLASRSCNPTSAGGSSTRRASATTPTTNSAARRPSASRRLFSFPKREPSSRPASAQGSRRRPSMNSTTIIRPMASSPIRTFEPETSIGYDAGLEQALLPDRISFGATYFANNIKNLIDVNDTYTSYVNVGRARTLRPRKLLEPFALERLYRSRRLHLYGGQGRSHAAGPFAPAARQVQPQRHAAGDARAASDPRPLSILDHGPTPIGAGTATNLIARGYTLLRSRRDLRFRARHIWLCAHRIMRLTIIIKTPWALTSRRLAFSAASKSH